MDSVY